jgi:hypothetical protein
VFNVDQQGVVALHAAAAGELMPPAIVIPALKSTEGILKRLMDTGDGVHRLTGE